MDYNKAIFSDANFDKYCTKHHSHNVNEGLFTSFYEISSPNTIKNTLVSIPTIEALTFELAESIHRLSSTPSHIHRVVCLNYPVLSQNKEAEPLEIVTTHPEKANDGNIFSTASLRIITSNLFSKKEVYVKGIKDSSTINISRKAAALTSKYILQNNAPYSRNIFLNTTHENIHDYDNTSLVEDLRRFIGETILESVVLIARRESSSQNKSIAITGVINNNERYLLDEIGERIMSKYRPTYSDFTKFKNILCQDINNFVQKFNFSDEWGDLVYNKSEDAVYLRINSSDNYLPSDSPLTNKLSIDELP